MHRVPRLTQLAGVCALVLSALALGVAPADAVTSSPAVAATGSFSSDTEGTVTVTYSNFSYPFVFVYAEGDVCPDPEGGSISTPPLYTIGTGSPFGASPVTITVSTSVVPGTTIPPGAYTTIPPGAYTFCLFNAASPQSIYLISEGAASIYTPMTSSFVTNSDGTITITYANANANANANSDFGQTGALLLATGVTECPVEVLLSITTGFAFQLGTPDSPLVAGTPSGTVIGVGTLAIKLPVVTMEGFAPQPVTEGLYQVCLYQPDGEGNVAIHQSASFFVREVPVEPVTPAFTG